VAWFGGRHNVLALGASAAEPNRTDCNREQHEKACQHDRKADAPRDFGHDERRDGHEDFEQHNKLRAPSALSHASSAASAICRMTAAAQG